MAKKEWIIPHYKGDTIKSLAESKPKYKYDPRSILKRY